MPKVTRLDAYVSTVVLAAVPVLVVVLALTPWSHLTDDPVTLLVLAGFLVVGEQRPIMISHGDDSVDLVTISSCFALALTLQGPLAAAFLAQVLALVVDDVRRRSALKKVLFNVATFVLLLATVRATYCALTGRGFLADDRPMELGDLAPAMVAAVVFFVVNTLITTTVVAIATRQPVLLSILRDLRGHAPSTGALLALAPVVVHAVVFSPFLVLLLLLPIAAVHKSSRIAIERERQALHDTLTGLPNRALFNERVARALGEHEEGYLAVMLTDLDHFKEINDTLGHHTGDLLLQQVATRVRDAVREEDTVARLGGDEFALLCPALPSVDVAEQLAARVTAALEAPFQIEGVRLDIRASVGIAVAPLHGDHAQTLMQRADVALYEAKVQRGTYAMYVPEQDEHSVEKLALLGELRAGITRDELLVHYQPSVDARTGRVVCVEALVRWQHPTRGLIFPDLFIPIAENTGLIGPLTEVVLEEALGQIVAWEADGVVVDVSVNLSARQLTDLDLPRLVEAALARHGLAPSRLMLEVTESHIVADAGRAAMVLRGLREVGVRLAVDDFGTGYSSLTQLRSLAVDVLKIDKSFVLDMTSDENDALIVRSTIDLGHNLGLKVVAEGVEDRATWDALVALGCDVVQGYHLSRPAAPEPLLQWLRDRVGPTAELPAPRAGSPVPTGS